MLVGLGNPGPKYETTRHNAGFLILDELAAMSGLSFTAKKFQAEFCKGRFKGQDAVFLKPQEYMNRSGRSVREAMRFFKVSPQHLIVFHDDIDQDFGKVKAKVGGGHGGHNGIRSILAETGEAGFHRIKLGVGRPSDRKDGEVSDWVLSQFSDEELICIQKQMLDDCLVRLDGILKQLKL